ncbi:MAG: hypothetical protein B7Z81_09420 [Acidocella sp. 20-61-6]|nr:MAG: hypothetical protein B7Z81_09420 [Acidocella sp. 20-61-6]
MKEFSNASLASTQTAATIPMASMAQSHPAPIPAHAQTQTGLDGYDAADALEAAFSGGVVTGALLFAAFSVHFLLAQLGAGSFGIVASGALYLAAGVTFCLTVAELVRGVARLTRG